ncbi:MAG: hypothetical protein GX279_07370 [Clostridiaceae bacterium]|jgi:hypothetical protein|nr:hypothetical protein [Clostridiaceae bacterium]
MKNSGKVLGGILICLGILFLLNNFKLINFWGIFGFVVSRLWATLFIIVPGLMFHWKFFSGSRRNPGILVPGGILLIIGMTLQFNMLFGGWGVTWPLFIFSVAFGLFELYCFGNREKGLLIPIGILGGLSAIFFFSFSLSKMLNFNTGPYAIPIVLIVIGLIVLSGGKKGKSY